MAAGLGFKNFTTGEVLTAGDVNGYLMQGVLVFANAAARNAAITSPQEGQFAFTKDTNGLWFYDGAAWVASGATGDIEGVTAGIGISGGGTSGTVTVTNSMATAIDAKGDLVAGTGADAFARVAVGSNGTVLHANSATATGLEWSAITSGGYTALASGSLTSGALSLTGISGAYQDLVLVLNNWQVFTNMTIPNFQLNNSGSNTAYTMWNTWANNQGTTMTTVMSANSNNLRITPFASLSGNVANVTTITFPQYASTTARKGGTIQGVVNNNSVQISHFGNFFFIDSAAITQISFGSSVFNGGNYVLYGVR